MISRILSTKFSLDSSILDFVALRNEPNINRIMVLSEQHDLGYCFIIPHSVWVELDRPQTPENVRKILPKFIKTMPVALNPQEIERMLTLFQVAAGNAQSKNIISDLQHVAESAKYGNYLITVDKRLLNRKDKVREVFPGLTVIEPIEALQTLEQAIRMCSKEIQIQVY